MPMKPGKGEDQAAFMKRCLGDMSDKYEHDQAIAACLNMWRGGKSIQGGPILVVPLGKAAGDPSPSEQMRATTARADKIGRLVKQNYGHDDGADLAHNLLSQGTITDGHSDDEAARIVAQHIEQA